MPDLSIHLQEWEAWFLSIFSWLLLSSKLDAKLVLEIKWHFQWWIMNVFYSLHLQVHSTHQQAGLQVELTHKVIIIHHRQSHFIIRFNCAQHVFRNNSLTLLSTCKNQATCQLNDHADDFWNRILPIQLLISSIHF